VSGDEGQRGGAANGERQDGRARPRPPAPPDAYRPPHDKPGQIGRRHVHSGRVVELYVDDVRFPDGSTGQLETIRHSGAAAVLPLLDDGPDPTIVLLRQFRYATGGELLEVPAGRPDSADEPWETCAHRELEEETGLRAGRLEYLTGIWTTPGFTDELIHLFLARDLSPGQQATDDDEFLEPIRLRLSDAVDRVLSGAITDSKTIATLLIAAERLRRG